LAALHLFNQRIFYSTGVLVKENWGFSSKVLKDFKTFVAYLT
jgi:hypothetical protein